MEKITLNFVCPLTKNDFSKSAAGLHCGMCKKDLIDFRGKSTEDINAYAKSSGSFCGIFDSSNVTNQTPELYEPAPAFYRSSLLSKVRVLVAASALFILFGCEEQHHTMTRNESSNKSVVTQENVAVDEKENSRVDIKCTIAEDRVNYGVPVVESTQAVAGNMAYDEEVLEIILKRRRNIREERQR